MSGMCIDCGLIKKIHAGGKCRSCYDKDRRERDKALIAAGRATMETFAEAPEVNPEEFMVISIDLSGHQEVLRALQKAADDEDRTPVLQARHILRKALTGQPLTSCLIVSPTAGFGD